MQIVNGYVCMTGCDAAAARRGVDPRNPTGDPLKQAALDAQDPAKAAARRPDRTAEGLGTVLDIST